MNGSLLDEVIDYLNASNETALEMSDHLPGSRTGITFTSEVVFMLAHSLEQHREFERARLRRAQAVATVAFLVSVVSFVLSIRVWMMQ